MNLKNLLNKIMLPVITSVVVIGGFSVSNKQFIDANAETNRVIAVDQYSFIPIFVSVEGTSGYSRTIISFDTITPMASIDRLTVTVSYKTYKNGWDEFWKVNPVEIVRDFTVLATDTTPFEDKSRDVLNTLLSINTTDYFDEENGRFFMNPYQIQNDTYDLFLEQQFYVVIPVAYSYETIFISGAGTTSEGDYINDGTNEGGFYEDDLGYYIDFDTDAPYIHFPDAAQINYIRITNYGGVGTIKIQFGDYDYEDNTLSDITSNLSFTGNTFVELDSLMVSPRTEAYVSTIGIAFGNVRIGYDSSTPAVSYNIVDEEGNLPDPVITDDQPDFWSWLKDFLMETFGDEIAQFIKGLKIVGYIAVGSLFLGLVVWPLLKSRLQQKQIDRSIQKSLAKQKGR